jgi:hypothetical protein
LAGAVFVFNQAKAHMIVTVFAKTNAGRYRDLGIGE